MPPTNTEASDVKAVLDLMEELKGRREFPWLNDLTFTPQGEQIDAVNQKLLIGSKQSSSVWCYLFIQGARRSQIYFQQDGDGQAINWTAMGTITINLPFRLIKHQGRSSTSWRKYFKAFVKASFIMKGLTESVPIEFGNHLTSELRRALQDIDLKRSNGDHGAKDEDEAQETRFDPRGTSRSRTSSPNRNILNLLNTPRGSNLYGMFGGSQASRIEIAPRRQTSPPGIPTSRNKGRAQSQRVISEDSSSSEPLFVPEHATQAKNSDFENNHDTETEDSVIGNDHVTEQQNPDIDPTKERVTTPRIEVTGATSGDRDELYDDPAADTLPESSVCLTAENVREHLIASYLKQDKFSRDANADMNTAKQEQALSDRKLDKLEKKLAQLQQELQDEKDTNEGHKRKAEEAQVEMDERAKRMKDLKSSMTGEEGFELAMRMVKGGLV